MRVQINGKKLEIDGWYYAGFKSRDRLEPDEPEEFIIDHITLLEAFDEVDDDIYQDMDYDLQLEFLGVTDEELSSYVLNYYLGMLEDYKF
jgi:hypothetical protein